jgi:DNA primase
VAAAQEERKSIDALVELGLVRRAESGRPYDFFRRRVLIPIRDRLGRCVGFGGRILPSPAGLAASEGAQVEAGPKYINTSETILFHKGRLIFGLDLAADSVRRTGQILIVEGYTDVMAAHQAGWACAVAVLGTATTEDHAALIRRSGARRVTLVFDGDEAGRRASTRALAGLLRLPVELRVAVLPEGRDPGDLLVEEQGRSEFRERVESARDWFDWSLEGLTGKRGGELSAAVEERFQLLLSIDRPVEQSSRLAELARFLALPEADVRAHWQAFERGQRPRSAAPASAGGRSRPAPAARSAPASGTGLERAYGLLFGALLLDNSLVPVHAPLLEGCPEGELKTLFGTLLDLYERGEPGEPIDASSLLTALADHPARARVVELQALAEGAESPEILARDQARWIERARAARELERLKRALPGTPLGEDDAAREVLARIHQELRVGRVPTSSPASAVSPEP